MSDSNNKDYLQIGFNDSLQRSDSLVYPLGNQAVNASNPQGAYIDNSINNGNVQNMAVNSDGGIGDIWINNFIKSNNWKPKTVGFYIDGQTGYAEFSNVYVSGIITAIGGTIGGFSIGADYIRDSANSFGLASTITGGDDVRFWAGDTFANRATAPFRVFESGEVDATAIFITGTSTVGGRLNTVISSVIDANSQIVTSRLKTSTKEILDGFKFTASGALNISATQTDVTVGASSGDVTLNVTSTTGFPASGVFYLQGNTNWMRITYTGKTGTTLTGIPGGGAGSITEASAIGKQVIGGPGVLITPKGLVALNASGVETITLDGSTGNATFAGTLVAASGSLGAITVGTNAFHVDSSGNMWWGASGTYAGATDRISGAGLLQLSSAQVGIFATNAGSVQKITIGNANTDITIQDASANVVLYTSGAVFTNGVLTVDTQQNDFRALRLKTTKTTGTAETAYFLNAGASQVLILESSNAGNTSTIFSTIGSGPTWHASFGGQVNVLAKLQIDIDNADAGGLVINSTRQGSSIVITETATSGGGAIIDVTSSRPAGGFYMNLSHTTNIQKGLAITYGGDGVGGDGIVDITAGKTNNVATCIALKQVSSGKAHINFSGSPTNGSPTNGDMWFDGTNMNMRVSGVTKVFTWV